MLGKAGIILIERFLYITYLDFAIIIASEFKHFLEPGHIISYNTACAPSEGSDLRCPPEDALDPCLPLKSSSKNLIRLRGFAC